MLTRVAASHLRVGTFVLAAARRDEAALRALVDYTVERHFPEIAEQADEAERPLALLAAVIARQAKLVAQWMSVGFVHGVMNTDNMALSGETIDYGPCAFLDAYDPATVFSSIDRRGRYAFGNQPGIAAWNLSRFAETLLPLIDAGDEQVAVERATAVLHGFADQYDAQWLALHNRKLGLFGAEAEDAALHRDMLAWMQAGKADFTRTFAELDPAVELAAGGDPARAAWHQRWRARLARQAESAEASAALRAASNPTVIPRNHLVEAALTAASESGDLGPFDELCRAVTQPFARGAEVPTKYREPAPAEAGPYVTFCGT